METTDLHVHIHPFDYYANRPSNMLGLANTAGLIAKIRKEAANSILIDNGDFLQGSPLGDYIAYERGMKFGDTHPIIEAMNHLGYDAATLGNHEFNYGLSFLMKTMGPAKFPVVCANAALAQGAGPRGDQTLFPPYVILDRMVTDDRGEQHSLRIGLIGFVPPQISNWDESHLAGKLVTRDIVETARAYVPEMKEAGADIIIALAHSGIGPGRATHGMENAGTPLCAIKGIDALAAGHSHLVFPSPHFSAMDGINTRKGTIFGKPAVMAGFWGSHLGLIDLLLQREGGEWHILNSRSEAIPIATRVPGGKTRPMVAPATDLLRKTLSSHKATLSFMSRNVGHNKRPLHSYFALISNAPALQLVCDAQAWYIRARLADSEYAALPLLSAAAPYKAGLRSGPDNYTDVPAGGLALRNIADLYAFPNTIRAVVVTGAQLREWLERSATLYNRIKPGKADQELINPDFPSYGFDVISGVTYEIDLSQPARYSVAGRLIRKDARRIRDLRCNDEPVADDSRFVLATNNFRVDASLDLTGPDAVRLIYSAPVTNRDILRDYVARQSPIDIKAKPCWRFAPMPGTTMLFSSSPRARDYLADLPEGQLTAIEEDIDGFLRFRLRG